MTHLTCHFLGQFEVKVDGKAFTAFHSDKARALLAYLALQPQQHSRSALAALIWPEIADKYALTNLRNTLYRLRLALDSALPGLADEVLRITRQTVQCTLPSAAVDVRRFQALLDAASAKPGALHTTQMASLAEAVSLYRGELLAGLVVEDAPDFAEWVLLRRELLQQRACWALRTLSIAYENAGDLERAHQLACRLVVLDPYAEDAHRQVMHLLAQLGQRDQAVLHFEQMHRRFKAELGVNPSEQTIAFVKQIAGSRVDTVMPVEHAAYAARSDEPVPPAIAATPRYHDLNEVPEVGFFFGREAERQKIRKWLLNDRCRVVALFGIAGVGKTSLAAKCVREVVAEGGSDDFDNILWYSLLNAPPLEQLLPSILQILADRQPASMPESIDEQLRSIGRYFREKRVLLVLDNLESILDAKHAGTFRAGYEAYGQLIRQMATFDHASHLLLTSREQPVDYARLEGDTPLVCSIQLEGLDDDAGRELLAQRGVQGDSLNAITLVRHYSGNPLALKLVADTVEEIFGGDVTEFLKGESPVFDDVRALLDQQFARLSDVERQILFWLAVEREPAPLTLLRTNLLHRPAQSVLVEALRNLQRHCLIERFETGFALQNVVTEYLTERLLAAAWRELETGELHVLHFHALMKAQSKTHIRESQVRLILKPICEHLLANLGRSRLQQAIWRCLEHLRGLGSNLPTYGAGNLLNLLLHLQFDLTGADFSQLNIRQAYLQGVSLPAVDFSYADFADSIFTSSFGRIRAIAISPDSKLLAMGEEGGEVRVWRIADGQLTAVLRRHPGMVVSIAFSPDSRHLLCSSQLSGTIYLWDVESDEVVTEFSSDQGGSEAVTFSPDGTLVAGGGHDGVVYLWETATGRLLQRLEMHEDWVTALAFHPTGDLLASCSLSQNECVLWQRQAARDRDGIGHFTYLASLAGHEHVIRAVAFSPDGTRLATGSLDHTIRMWDVARRECIQVLHAERNGVRSLAFAPDGSYLASSGNEFAVRIWDVQRGKPLNVLRAHNQQVWAIAISGDGKTLASGDRDSVVHLWEMEHPKYAHLIRTLRGYVHPFSGMVLSPRGDRFATGEQDGHIRLWQHMPADTSTAAGPVVETPHLLMGHTAMVDSLAFSADGRWLVSGSHDTTARLWDVASKACIATLRIQSQAGIKVAFHPGGNLIACGVANSILLWDISAPGESRTTTLMPGHTRDIRGLNFSPTGQYLASCSVDDTVRIWKVVNGECIHTLAGELRHIWAAVYSPDGQRLAVAGRNGIDVWDLSPDVPVRLTYPALAAATAVRSVGFSPNGKLLVSGGTDRMVRIWDLETGRELHTLAGHTGDTRFTDFLPDGERVISAGYDGIVRIWELQSETCTHSMSAPGPYAGMDITGVRGLAHSQVASLKLLGAVERRP